MSVIAMRIVGLSAAGLITMGTGVVLTRAGRPFGTALLNVHKLVALAAIVYVGVLAFRDARAGAFSSADWVVLASALVLSIAVLVSGGLVSALESAPGWVVWMHRIGSWLSVLAIAAVARLVL